MAELPTKDDLAKLPGRAIVCYAATCLEKAMDRCGLREIEEPNIKQVLEAASRFFTGAERFPETRPVESLVCGEPPYSDTFQADRDAVGAAAKLLSFVLSSAQYNDQRAQNNAAENAARAGNCAKEAARLAGHDISPNIHALYKHLLRDYGWPGVNVSYNDARQAFEGVD